MAIADSVVDVKIVHELFQSPAEPITDFGKPEPMAIADSVDDVKAVHELFQSPAEPITDSYKPEPMAIADSVDDVKAVHELCQSPAEPITDSYKPEPMTITGSVDDVKVVHELFQSPAEPKTDFSGPDVNASPNSELKSSEPDAETDLNLYEHKILYQRSEPTCSDIAENDGIFCGPSSDNCTGELEMENEDLAVVFYPDHMVYRGSYCTDCVLTFTSSCIKIEGSAFSDDDITLRLQWGVQDILSFKSQMYELAGMAMVTIHVHTEDTIQAVNGESTSGDEIKFAIIGNNWYGRQEAVTYLNDKYKTLWSSMLESEESVNRDIQASLTKYFPNFDQPFEDVIYPKGDVDAVSISKRDVDLLLPDTFVNDTVIDFYIKYLKDRIKPEEKHRFHFFNSFFFRKLADPEKGPLDASEGKVAFQRVKKWTRKVNLFEKDYVFIPVNYGYHWSLLVLCHLGEVATCKDEDVTKLKKVPCVLHMDSIRGTHTGLKDLMQSYLKEEWKARQQEASEDIVSRFDDMRFISLELPQQPNSSDCGLFLLHYVELFLEQAPLCFNPFHITNSENFLSADWFLPAEASLKRTVVQRLVYDILEQPAPPSMAANEDNNIQQKTAVNFFAERCNPSTVCQSSQDQRIEISLLPSLSMANEPCFVGPTESYKPASEPGSFLGMQFPSFNESMFDGYKSSLISPIQEDAENGGQYIYSSTEIDLQQDNEISPDIPYTSLDFKSRESWHQNGNIETSPQTSISGCEESLEVINGNNQSDQPLVEPVNVLDDNDNDNGDQISQPRSPLMDLAEMLDNDNGNQIDQPRSPLMDPVEMRHNYNKGSLKEPVEMFHDNGNGNQGDQPRSPLMGLVEVLDGNGNSNSNGNGNDGGLTLSSNFFEMQVDGPTGFDGAPGLESDVEHPTKKMRMTESLLEGGPTCS
ncbi:putative ubiquitin-like-specific protease 2B [Bidens hawaiensis]|uniref:putative ubiquitin-like-specific protease 2B n=1 Tax=Bidens hawaiensis TaxID=980011 RepID=UPI00404B4289